MFRGIDNGMAVGELYGHRVFDMKNNTVVSPVQTFNWTPGKNTAKCDMGCRKSDRRNAMCSCGFYAYFKATDDYRGNVRGIVKGYGMVDRGTQGFQAEYAELLAISVPADMVNSKDKAERRSIKEVWKDLSVTTVTRISILNAILLSMSASTGVSSAIAGWPNMLTFAAMTLAVVFMFTYVILIHRVTSLRYNKYSHVAYGQVIDPPSPRDFNHREFAKKYPNVQVFGSDKEMYAAFAVKFAEQMSKNVYDNKKEKASNDLNYSTRLDGQNNDI